MRRGNSIVNVSGRVRCRSTPLRGLPALRQPDKIVYRLDLQMGAFGRAIGPTARETLAWPVRVTAVGPIGRRNALISGVRASGGGCDGRTQCAVSRTP